jgi:hypothetical protein
MTMGTKVTKWGKKHNTHFGCSYHAYVYILYRYSRVHTYMSIDTHVGVCERARVCVRVCVFVRACVCVCEAKRVKSNNRLLAPHALLRGASYTMTRRPLILLCR